jgi:hypothetical protein
MNFSKPHEIHQRRLGRNLGVGLLLGSFVAVVFGLTVAKLGNGGEIKGIDFVVDTSVEAPE